MPKFKCINESCSLYQKEKITSSVTFIWDKVLKKLKPTIPIICPECGREMEEIKKKEGFSANFLKFKSLSPEEKRRITRKRAADHYKKSDEADRRYEKRNEIINNTLNIAKGKGI